MGLGPAHTVTLAEAREHATDCRKQRLRGIDPIEARHGDRANAKLDAAKAMTFRQCADAYIEAHKTGWSNAKHAAQWPATLTTYPLSDLRRPARAGDRRGPRHEGVGADLEHQDRNRVAAARPHS